MFEQLDHINGPQPCVCYEEPEAKGELSEEPTLARVKPLEIGDRMHRKTQIEEGSL